MTNYSSDSPAYDKTVEATGFDPAPDRVDTPSESTDAATEAFQEEFDAAEGDDDGPDSDADDSDDDSETVAP